MTKDSTKPLNNNDYTPSKKCNELTKGMSEFDIHLSHAGFRNTDKEDIGTFVFQDVAKRKIEQLDQFYQGLQEQNQNLKVLVMSKDKEIESLKKEIEGLRFQVWVSPMAKEVDKLGEVAEKGLDAVINAKQLELLREIQAEFNSNIDNADTENIDDYNDGISYCIEFIQNKIKELEDSK